MAVSPTGWLEAHKHGHLALHHGHQQQQQRPRFGRGLRSAGESRGVQGTTLFAPPGARTATAKYAPPRGPGIAACLLEILSEILRVMKETIRCCISYILPCNALDVVRIMHANGRVEEISGTVSASEIKQAYPKHILRKPPSAVSDDGVVPKAVILPPNAELHRGKIYFLMPVSSVPEKARSGHTTRRRRKKREEESNSLLSEKTRLFANERYLSEILSEKVSTKRDRRRGRIGVWRPHLESISEVSNDF